MNDLKKEIEKILKARPSISAAAIAEKLGAQAKDVGKILKNLKNTSSHNKKNRPADKDKTEKKEDKNLKKSHIGKTFIGTIDAKNDNFAFFIPEDKNMDDVFVHRNNFNGAVNSDKVAVQIGVYRGRKEAVVEKIIERGIKEITGVADFYNGICRVIPFSRSFNHDLIIKKPGKIEDGDVVVCSIEKYPEKNLPAVGKILKRICKINDPDADNLVVLHKFGLKRSFPHEVAEAAAAIGKGEVPYEDRRPADFTELFTVTIDGESARDFDDAISIGKDGENFVLYVHIADVSRFVNKGEAIDVEAQKRGTSVYFPQFAVPMLPEVLSNDKCSLVPGEERFAVTAKMVFDLTGRRISSEFTRSLIKSDRRLTYGYVNSILSGSVQNDDENLRMLLSRCEALGELLQERRCEGGYIDFDTPEARFIFDEKGGVENVIQTERGFSERMIELFMVAANEAAATYLSENNVDSVYRIHGQPDPKKIQTWVETARMFGLVLPEVSFPIDNEGVAALAEAASNSKYKDILSSMLIKCMMRAEYSVKNMGHFGLNSPAYTHFTSPIRRYPDLLVHRAILDKLKQGPRHETLEELEELAPALSKLERLADDAEHEISLFKKIEYMQERPDEVYAAYINRVSHAGFFIYVEKLMMTGFVDFATIDFDTFYTEEFSAVGRATGERFRVGDKIEVKLFSANIFLLQADFAFVGKTSKHNT